MAIFKRGKTWWLDITSPSGERVRRSAKTRIKSEAQELHDRLKAELWRVKVLGDKPQRTWKEAVVRWYKDKSAKKDLPRDIDKFAWLDPILGDLFLHEVNEDHIEEIVETKRDAGVGDTTINRYLALVRSVLRAALNEWRWILAMPYIPKFKEKSGRERFLTREQADRLEAALPVHYRTPMRFALATGLRQSPLLHARWDQIDLRRKVMTIIGGHMKNGKPLRIPLNADALAVLEACKGQHETYVFTRDGQPFFNIDSRLWKQALITAGLEDFRWHDLRHTWASWHVQAGTTLIQLMELGGWKSFTMVQRYAHFNTQHLVEPAKNVERARQQDLPPPAPASGGLGTVRRVAYLRVVK